MVLTSTGLLCRLKLESIASQRGAAAAAQDSIASQHGATAAAQGFSRKLEEQGNMFKSVSACLVYFLSVHSATKINNVKTKYK